MINHLQNILRGQTLGLVAISVLTVAGWATDYNRVEASDGNGAVLRQLDTNFDTDFADEITSAREFEPIGTNANLRTTAPLGKNSQSAINPPGGVKTQSNLGFFPSLSITVSSQDNPARVADGDSQSDTSFSISPKLKYRGAINSRHIYELAASARSESYEELSSLDSDDLQLSAAIKLDISEKVKADIYGQRAENDDPRGRTATRIIGEQIPNDEFVEESIGGRLTLGRRSNRLQLVVGVERAELDFTNNDQDQRDREDTEVSAGLYLNVAPKTSLFVTGATRDVDFSQASSSTFNSTDTEIAVGVGWEPSYTTSLLVQVGNIEKEFDQGSFPDQDSDSYLGKLSWLPTQFTTVSLYASRAFEESTALNSPVIISDVFGVNLEHAFYQHFQRPGIFKLH